MNENKRKLKISSAIYIAAILISFAATIVSSVHLRDDIFNGCQCGPALTIFFASVSILLANLTILLAGIKKYRKISK